MEFVPKRRCSITKRSIGEFESKTEFRMSQQRQFEKRVGRVG